MSDGKERKVDNAFVRKSRSVERSDGGRHVEISKYNKLTGKGIYKEKDITKGSSGEKRVKYVEKHVVRRDKALNWKSSSESRKLIVGGKVIKKEKNKE
jgi:hypothetical protein